MGRAIGWFNYCDLAAQEFHELRLQAFQTPRSPSVSITTDSTQLHTIAARSL